jgi:hypothetical protein
VLGQSLLEQATPDLADRVAGAEPATLWAEVLGQLRLRLRLRSIGRTSKPGPRQDSRESNLPAEPTPSAASAVAEDRRSAVWSLRGAIPCLVGPYLSGRQPLRTSGQFRL